MPSEQLGSDWSLIGMVTIILAAAGYALGGKYLKDMGGVATAASSTYHV